MNCTTKKPTTRNKPSKKTDKKILITDNHLARRASYSKLLQRAGHYVELADNGADMLAKLLMGRHYDLIAIDVSLTYSTLPLIGYALENKLVIRDSILILVPFNLSCGLAKEFERLGIHGIVRRSLLHDYVSRWLESSNRV